MEVTVLDQNFVPIKVVDTFESLIWTDRYYGAGDFEIVTKVTRDVIDTFRQDYYLTLPGSEHVMVIETVRLVTDVEEGDKYTIVGRSLESILDRRIIWNQTGFSGSLQNGIKKFLNENAIVPTDLDRKITNLVFQTTGDPKVTDLTFDGQYYGHNLYAVVLEVCQNAEIGFKVTLSSSNTFVFQLYAGFDRTSEQTSRPVVSFSPNLDNLISSNYFHSKMPYKTVTLVAGEGDGSDKQVAIAMLPDGAGTSLARREKFTDASDLSKNVEGGTLTTEQYNTLLLIRGMYSLLESRPVSGFDGIIDPNVTYIYGVDFFVGDKVEIANEYGLKAKTRITELTFSEDLSGSNIFPTFELVE